MKKDQFFSKLLVSITKGENHPLIANEFASFLDTSYTASVEVMGDIRFQGKVWQARFLFNIPFNSGGATLANLTSPPVFSAHQADYSQISLSYTHQRLQVGGLGFAQLGIISNFTSVFEGNEDILSLLRGVLTARVSFHFSMHSIHSHSE